MLLGNHTTLGFQLISQNVTWASTVHSTSNKNIEEVSKERHGSTQDGTFSSYLTPRNKICIMSNTVKTIK